MKYKVGDMVKLRKDSEYNDSSYPYQIPEGTYATIIEINTDSWSDHVYGVQWVENGNYEINSYREKDLVITVKATKLSRKIYPKSKVSECGEWIEI